MARPGLTIGVPEPRPGGAPSAATPGGLYERLRAGGRGTGAPGARREAAADPAGDRGSGAIAIVIFALLFLALASFVVDGGMAISKRERAADLAEQAARYAAQDIDVEAVRNATQANATAPILVDNCRQNVRKFLASAGVALVDRVNSGCDMDKSTTAQVYVYVQITYKPMLTGILFDGDLTAKGTASATNLSGN